MDFLDFFAAIIGDNILVLFNKYSQIKILKEQSMSANLLSTKKFIHLNRLVLESLKIIFFKRLMESTTKNGNLMIFISTKVSGSNWEVNN